MVTAEPIRIIDVDTHISEPPDLWTARVSKKWGDQVLHVRPDNRTGALAWFIADDYIAPAPAAAMAGWKEPPPSNPPNYDEAHPGAFKAEERLQLMDEEGIYAHIIYPNVGGFIVPVRVKREQVGRRRIVRSHPTPLVRLRRTRRPLSSQERGLNSVGVRTRGMKSTTTWTKRRAW